MLQHTHLEKDQRRARRTPGGGRIHRLQRLFNRLPIQSLIQPPQKLIGRRGDHQAVQQSHLCVGPRLHDSLTPNQIIRSKEFCRGLTPLPRHKFASCSPLERDASWV